MEPYSAVQATGVPFLQAAYLLSMPCYVHTEQKDEEEEQEEGSAVAATQQQKQQQ